MNADTLFKIEKSIVSLRQKKPLILNLTNFVTMDFVANCQLALGAAPIVSTCEEELEELVFLSSAVYVNIGTLSLQFIGLVKKAIDFAKKHHKHIVFDPVGSGSSQIRSQISQEIAPHACIVRGNASEIRSLSGFTQIAKGVESVHSLNETKDVAIAFARQYQTIVVVSGPIDFITDGKNEAEVPYGCELMTRVTGMGCALTSLLAAFQSMTGNPFEASLIGTHYFALCGQLAAEQSNYPGTYKNHFIDQLHASDFKKMERLLCSRLP